MTLDAHGNLFVSDNTVEIAGNWRLLEYSKSVLNPPNPPVVLIYDPSATKNFANSGGLFTWEPAFDQRGRIVGVGYNWYRGDNPYPPGHSEAAGKFLGLYKSPLSASKDPDALLFDYNSWAVSASFDDLGNLYSGDVDRFRVLI